MLSNERGGDQLVPDTDKRAVARGAPALANTNQQQEGQVIEAAAAAAAEEEEEGKEEEASKLAKSHKQKGAADNSARLDGERIDFGAKQSQQLPAKHVANLRLLQQQTIVDQENNTNHEQSSYIDDNDDQDEKRRFLVNKNFNHLKNNQSNNNKRHQAKLAKQESLLSETTDEQRVENNIKRSQECCHLSALYCCACCCTCLARPDAKKIQNKKTQEQEEKMCRRKRRLWLLPLLLVLIYSVAIYCLPFVDMNPSVPEALPNIPFNFNQGPLKPSTASQFRVEHLFRGQIHGPESMAMDSYGNAYLAIEGGLILYAHLNRSSSMKAQYLLQLSNNQQQQQSALASQDLIKIAELNGVKQVSTKQQQQQRRVRSQNNELIYYHEPSSIWRRECLLDEQLYGNPMYSPTSSELLAAQQSAHGNNNFAWYTTGAAEQQQHKFVSRVKNSRCSKPLGTRLTPDESYLYVIDTLSGLYRIHLKVPERKQSNHRLVARLIDFRANNWQQTLPAIQLDTINAENGPIRSTRLMNVSMKAVDDLTIDYGAGTKGGDLIYMSVASQQWPAQSFIYDMLEGRPSGLIVRYDTGNGQLVILEPKQLAHVRTSSYDFSNTMSDDQMVASTISTRDQVNQSEPSVVVANFGIPRLDENDVFDDRPLNFPNGIELMDDKQALLVVDTGNKRIIKHYVRGPRRGTSDLWAYTPNYPDNIRRGYDKRYESYWVVGCGQSTYTTTGRDFDTQNQSNDAFALLRSWPYVKKFLLKNMYFFGWFIETLGQYILMSENIRDFGYGIKTGSYFCQNGCKAMMILQFNQNGDLIRSVHSVEFPNDLKYYSQVNELIDAQSQEHSLYLSSPSYDYITKLVLPTESYPHTAGQPSSM